MRSGCLITGSQNDGGRECRGGNSPTLRAVPIEPPIAEMGEFCVGDQIAGGIEVIDGNEPGREKLWNAKLGVTPNC